MQITKITFTINQRNDLLFIIFASPFRTFERIVTIFPIKSKSVLQMNISYTPQRFPL